MSRYTIRGYKYGDTECPMSKLQDLENKIEDGVLVELPCRVGQKVYVLSRYYGSEWEVYECRVYEYTIYEHNIFMGIANSDYNFGSSVREIGVSVFLTREEAEKTLAEIKEHTDGKADFRDGR